MWQQVRVRLRSLWHWRRQESELDEEIRFHLAEEVDDNFASRSPAGGCEGPFGERKPRRLASPEAARNSTVGSLA